MARERTFRWIVRSVFWTGLLYTYLAIFRQPAFAPYRFLLENLFLAYVPVELSFHLEGKTPRVVFWAVFAVWFFFYPNAPYMLTDFFHLALCDPYILRPDGARTGLLRPDMRMWAMCSRSMWGFSRQRGRMRFIRKRVRSSGRSKVSLLQRFGRWTMCWQAALVLVVTTAASVGIYLGRFPRLHTAHLVTRPVETAKLLSSIWDLRLLEFVVMLTALQMAVWGLLLLLRAAPSRNGG